MDIATRIHVDALSAQYEEKELFLGIDPRNRQEAEPLTFECVMMQKKRRRKDDDILLVWTVSKTEFVIE
jgi:hypothetical protein